MNQTGTLEMFGSHYKQLERRDTLVSPATNDTQTQIMSELVAPPLLSSTEEPTLSSCVQ